jgi:formyltetrahydrofolate deformylase
MKTAIMLISCPDNKGITAAVTGFVFNHGGNIVHADQHVDETTNAFFMRIEWSYPENTPPREAIQRDFATIAQKYAMRAQLFFSDERPRLALFVSKHLHCLYDVLWKYRSGHFNCEIPLILSNHDDARPLAEMFGIPFVRHIVTKENKLDIEREQLAILREHRVETIGLARYMQVLSPAFVQAYPENIINIHHSFLPAFKGAEPYRQAYEKGVKIIGATGHYVNEDLDMGPIIEQDTARVSHRDTVDDLVRKGQDLEKVVFSRAIQWHCERKILAFSNKTVIFD